MTALFYKNGMTVKEASVRMRTIPAARRWSDKNESIIFNQREINDCNSRLRLILEKFCKNFKFEISSIKYVQPSSRTFYWTVYAGSLIWFTTLILCREFFSWQSIFGTWTRGLLYDFHDTTTENLKECKVFTTYIDQILPWSDHREVHW